VRFVTDDKVPVRRSLKLGLQRFRSGRTVEAHDETVSLDKRVAGDGSLDLIAGKNVEIEIKLFFEFVLPLLDEAPRRDDEASLQVALSPERL
jgi:hypothetical protein